MIFRRKAWIGAAALLAAALTGCGEPTSSEILQPLTRDDMAPVVMPPGALCHLSTVGDRRILLSSFGGTGVARSGGEPIQLEHIGGSTRAGGTFHGGGFMITIEVPMPQAASAEPIEAETKVHVRAGEREERFRAVWSC